LSTAPRVFKALTVASDKIKCKIIYKIQIANLKTVNMIMPFGAAKNDLEDLILFK